jgi:hypothetical protein
MQYTKVIRKPFAVDAVQITEENIAEIAKIIGELQERENGTPYIVVNRNVVPAKQRAYIGDWLTKMGEKYHCYTDKLFTREFVAHTESIQGWIDYLNDPTSEDASEGNEDSTEELPQPA